MTVGFFTNIGNHRVHVGGQAVIEGVMMRAPRSMAIAVRRPGGEIFVKEDQWKSLAERWRFLRWPFFRGGLNVVEALVNGMEALTFSANQALEGEGEDSLSGFSMFLTLILAFAAAVGLFVVVPHVLSSLAGRLFGVELGVRDFTFHLVDGVLKIAVFLTYVWAISMSKDIRRIFEYHGAEHKSVYAYEAGEILTVENARKFSTLHPRCGTAFILLVLVFSILLYSSIFPFLPGIGEAPGLVNHAIAVLLKIVLIFPIAGLAYEMIKFSARKMGHPLIRCIVLPGLWMQRLTTREPSDEQIEVALAALKKALILDRDSVNEGGVR